MRLSPADRDAAALNLLRLDPLRRHVQDDPYDVADLRALWNTAEAAFRLALPPVGELYPLKTSRERAAAFPEGRHFLQGSMWARGGDVLGGVAGQ